MAKHGETERFLKNLFQTQGYFSFEGINYNILKIDKPTIHIGECKTDLYILAENLAGLKKEFKISIKQNDADFLENKISKERAFEIFGAEMKTIISNNISRIKCMFENEPLIAFNKFKRTEKSSIKIGWKYELMNKISGEKSGILNLTKKQKLDIYAGSNLKSDKKNALIDGEIIENSGVANYILIVDRLIMDTNYYSDKLLDIQQYSEKQEVFFACKAINYRFDLKKWDGNRPLSVYCNWFLNDLNQLDCTIVYDEPLEKHASEIGENINKILEDLGINKFEELKSKISPDLLTH